MSHPLIPAKPAQITLDTLPELFAHHRARFGGWTMTQTPPEPEIPAEAPEGVSDEEWSALGDPGKKALVRERERADNALRDLAAARARPTPPAQPRPTPPGQAPAAPAAGSEPDVQALVEQAVAAAVKPFQEAEQTRQAQEAAGKIQTAVLEAAKAHLQDETDALANIDLTTVVNDQGQADAEKIKTALDALVVKKPHLAKSAQRFAPPGIGGGAPAAATDAERVKSVLADMQRATGVRIPAPSTTN